VPEENLVWAVAEPHPAVRPWVERYVGYVQHDVTLGVHRGLPSRHVTLIVSLDQPIRVTGMPLPGESPVSLQGLVGGMHVAPALVAQDRFQAGLHLELNPLGTQALLGLSAAELSGHVVGLDQLGSPRLAELPARLGEAHDWSTRFALLDETLAGVVADAEGPAGEVRWAWQRMRAARGRVRVATLADEVGWSRRHFGERFRAEIGLSPKQAARVLRFERAGQLLRRGRVDLANLAVDCGYYDQAHLTNEWRALAGCPPGTWIAEELPFLQDATMSGGED
jgi:AraC-like DNA-binding protein